jgi:hypothetical protein
MLTLRGLNERERALLKDAYARYKDARSRNPGDPATAADRFQNAILDANIVHTPEGYRVVNEWDADNPH